MYGDFFASLCLTDVGAPRLHSKPGGWEREINLAMWEWAIKAGRGKPPQSPLSGGSLAGLRWVEKHRGLLADELSPQLTLLPG